MLDEPSTAPDCQGGGNDDNPPRSWIDADGVRRYHCLFVPPGTSAASPRPLLIYLHGGYGSATTLYRTGIRNRAPSYDLSGDPTRPGFIVASVQARNLQWRKPTLLADGALHDFHHWDLGVPSGNPDIANLDRLIDDLVDIGADPERLYLMGWSAGALFAQMYGMARHGPATTPEGHSVAAVAVYSGSNPFDLRTGATRCTRSTLPDSTLPIFSISRTCDTPACDRGQRLRLEAQGAAAEVVSMAEWISQNDRVDWLLLTEGGLEAHACPPADLCELATARQNHLVWPRLREGEMLEFLRDHPR